MFQGNIKATISSLRRSKWRALMTMTGIIVGIALVVTIVSLGEGLKQQIVGQVNRLGSDVLTVRSGKLVSRKDGAISGVNLLAFLNSSTLTPRDVSALSKVPSVKEIAPVNFVTSNASSDSSEVNNAYVLGTSSALPRLLNQEMAYGDFFSDDDGSRKFAVIGSNIALTLYKELNPTGHTINIAGQDYIIRGVLAPSSGGLLSIGQTDFNSAVFISFEQSMKITNGSSNILQILLKSKDKNQTGATSDVRKTLLATHQGNEDFTVLKQEELLRVVNSVIDKMAAFIAALAVISLLVGGIGIMNIMLASVTERTREIGIRKAIGATNRQILKQFMTEGLVITISGGLIGVVLSLLVFAILRLYTGLHPVINVPIMLMAVFVSIAIGVIFSVAPALKAARKDPIQALRGD